MLSSEYIYKDNGQTSFTAHMRAMEPMLFVMVTRVALARSSLLMLSRLSLLIMWPKLKDKREIHPQRRPMASRKTKALNVLLWKTSWVDEKNKSFCTWTLQQIPEDQSARNHHHKYPLPACRRLYYPLSPPFLKPPRTSRSRSAGSTSRETCHLPNWDHGLCISISVTVQKRHSIISKWLNVHLY